MFNRNARILLFIGLIAALSAACAKERTETKKNNSKVDLCGIVFPRDERITVEATALSESFATSRVNQERYDVCPYKIKIKIDGSELDLDFSTSTTSADISNAKMSATPIYFGSWQFDGKEWRLDEDVFDMLQHPPVSVTTVDGGIRVSAIATRRPVAGSSPDVCFSLALIGAAGWAGGMTCKPSASALAPIERLKTAVFVLHSTEK